MSTYDLSRSATDFRKQYSGVRMQQGRVLMDDDWNENERLHAEDQRAVNVDVIGAAGSPDEGFRILDPKVDSFGNLDFTIQAGTYYLGGHRIELPAPQTYQLQYDWLQKPGEEMPGIPADGQCDLVLLEHWQQPIAAIEDSELLEPALGGPDTTARFRTMHRVRVASNLGIDQCCQAWEKLRNTWKLQGRGQINDQNELVPDVKLTVDFINQGNAGDLCSPPMAGGYLGAENQAIRVQLVDDTHLIWGFDNAAPLYRVQMISDGGRRVFTMLTPPKDQAHWPLSGQIVEILPWSAVLSNHEVISEVRGFLTRVFASYNPETKQFSLKTALPAGFGEDWKNRTDAAGLKAFDNFKDVNQFFYMRVWNRGGDVASEPKVSFQSQPVILGGTGLKITITGADRAAGDFWIIAARPDTPKRVLPWRLMEGAAPHGIRRYYAPLAVIQWKIQDKKIKAADVLDCRPTFVPLTAGWWGGGCSIIVAPRPGWERVFSLFHPGQDVSICFQAGDYRLDRTLLLDKLGTVKMTGAGSGTRIVASGCETVFLFRGCGSVLVRDLHIETDTSPAGREIAEQHLNGALTFLDCHDVRVSDCDLVCPDSAGRQQSCLTVRSNATAMRDLVRIERNRFVVGAWQTGILLVDVNRSTVSGNHLSLSKTAWAREWLAVPDFFASAFEQLVLEAVSSTPVSGTYGLKFTKSPDTKLQVFKGALTEPLVCDFAKTAPKNVAKAPDGVEGALSKFARGIATGRSISALSTSGKKTVRKIIEDLRAGGQGIVVAGTRIGTVQILENIVEDMIQGIHVGVSNPTLAGPEMADEIMISRNVVHSMVPQLFNRDRHAIFVGNARSISITDTVASLRRIGQPGKDALPVEGIRIHGVLGPFLVIRQSSLSGFTTGVRVVPLEPYPKQRLWLVTETMATGAAHALVTTASIVNERNIP